MPGTRGSREAARGKGSKPRDRPRLEGLTLYLNPESTLTPQEDDNFVLELGFYSLVIVDRANFTIIVCIMGPFMFCMGLPFFILAVHILKVNSC